MDQPLPFEIPNVTVLLQPEEQVLEIPRHKVKNVKQLLKYLGIRECTALVARGRELLTPDRAVLPHDNLLVRKVTSSGGCAWGGAWRYWGGEGEPFWRKVLLPLPKPLPILSQDFRLVGRRRDGSSSRPEEKGRRRLCAAFYCLFRGKLKGRCAGYEYGAHRGFSAALP